MFDALKKDHYANFYGRASRSEYWLFILFQFIITVLLTLLAVIVAVAFSDASLENLAGLIIIASWVIAFVCLIIPTLSVAIRRLHDINLSGWWYLLSLIIPFFMLVVAIIPGTKGKNDYGKDPLTDKTDNPHNHKKPHHKNPHR